MNEYKYDINQPKEYIDYLVNRQTIIKNNANERQKIYDELREKSHAKERADKEYEIGQKVLWNINSRFTGNRRKLGPKWIGPYEIVKIFNDYQNFKIRVIPLIPSEKNNPMNKHKLPKKIINQNPDIVEEFNVPRDQIKPYHPSYEHAFDGIQSPINLTIKYINKNIQKYTNIDKQIQSYQILFHLYQNQISMEY